MADSSERLRFHGSFLELATNPSIPIDEALKRATKWASTSIPDLSKEKSALGAIALETRRMSARAFIVKQALLKFDPKSSNAVTMATQLVQRWNVILELFENPAISIRLFTTLHGELYGDCDLMKPIVSDFDPLRILSPNVMDLMNSDAELSDDRLELLGRSLFYECMPTEHYSGLDFNVLQTFHRKVVEFTAFLNPNKEAILAAEPSTTPIYLGCLPPQTIAVVFNREGALKGGETINERILRCIKSIRMDRMPEDITKHVLKDYTMHRPVLRENEDENPLTSPRERPNTGHQCDSQTGMEALRVQLSRQVVPTQTFGRTLTQDVDKYVREERTKQRTKDWDDLHPFHHPIGVRLMFILQSLEVYEHAFKMDTISLLHKTLIEWPWRTKEVFYQWMTCHVPIRIIHDQLTLCHNIITTKTLTTNLQPLLREQRLMGKCLKDFGMDSEWVEGVRSCMGYLQLLSRCNVEREILCEVSPENPRVLWGYTDVKGAATRTAVVLSSPLVFLEQDRFCPSETRKLLLEARADPSLHADDDIPTATRVIDGYLHHQAFYSPILNAANAALQAESPIPSRRQLTDGFSPLLRYEFCRWLDDLPTNPTPEIDIMSRPALLDSANKYRVLQLFSNLAMAAQVQRDAGSVNLIQLLTGGFQPHFVMEVRRDHLLSDTIRILNQTKPANLRKNLRIKFVDEEGIDEGGLCKEFFQLLMEELFNPLYGMFVKNEDDTLWLFNPALKELEDLQNCVLVGLIFGLALYNGILLDIKFPRAIFKLLLDVDLTMQDLAQVEYTMAKSLWGIVDMSPQDFEALEFTWSATSNVYDESVTFPLISARGIEDPVLYAERYDYVDAYVKWKLFRSTERPIDCFRGGFYKVVSRSLLQPLKLHPEELEDLVIGCQTLIDINIIEKTIIYGDGYTKDSETVKHFWNITHEYSQEQLKSLIWFITGSDRLPVGGAADLRITLMRNGPNSELLPSAHTCFNYVLLPDYKDLDKLKIKMRIALENAQGFGLQ